MPRRPAHRSWTTLWLAAAPLGVPLVLGALLSAGCDQSSTTTTTTLPNDNPVATLPASNKTTSPASTEADTAEVETAEPKSPESPASPPPAGAAAEQSPAAPATKIVDKTFDDIKFEIAPGDPFERAMLTEPIEALDGQRIRIRGYMYPTMQRDGITKFVLVRDNLECCFGPGAALYDCIFVEMEPGKTTSFSARPIAVEGKFTINEVLGLDGTHLAIYHLDGEGVR